MKTLSYFVICAAIFLTGQNVISQSSADVPAKFISMPEYLIPREAEAAEIDDTIAVQVSVRKDGSVDQAKVILGPSWPCDSDPKDGLKVVRDGVEKAVKAAKFSPAIKDGKPHDAQLILTLHIGQRYERLKQARASGNTSDTDIFGHTKIGVTSGKLIDMPKPDYPREVRRSGIGGKVEVEVHIDEQGNVTAAGVRSGPPELQDISRAAACKGRFSPSFLNGQPSKAMGIVTFTFAP